MKRLLVQILSLLTLLTISAHAAPPTIPPPARNDKCPVCGMFVAKYREWIAAIRFTDGVLLYFDGVKDLMTFYHSPGSFAQGRASRGIRDIVATDYYSLQQIDATKAFYVVGSDVYGPMGNELIPFGDRKDAEEFLKDHKGKRILRFNEITPALLKTLQ
ncbi:MAG: nitrous oxide reductase accessory protein NosL [Desulfuromonadia bacterium]